MCSPPPCAIHSFQLCFSPLSCVTTKNIICGNTKECLMRRRKNYDNFVTVRHLLQSHQVYIRVVQGKWYIQSGDREKALGNPGRGKKHLLFFRHSHDQCLSKHSQNRNAPRGTQEEGMRWDAWVDLLRSGLQWCESHKTIQRCIVVTPCTNEAQVGRGREPAMRERKLLISDLLILWAVTYLYVWSFENTQEEWILHCLGNFTQQIYQKVLITNKVH